MNRDASDRDRQARKLLHLFAEIDRFLCAHNPDGAFLFEDFGLAETVFTPIFMRLWFLDYYEGFDLPDTADYARVRLWRDACLAGPEVQQTSREKVVKLYYNYAVGPGLPPRNTDPPRVMLILVCTKRQTCLIEGRP